MVFTLPVSVIARLLAPSTDELSLEFKNAMAGIAPGVQGKQAPCFIAAKPVQFHDLTIEAAPAGSWDQSVTAHCLLRHWATVDIEYARLQGDDSAAFFRFR
ncbi:hypothetical protein A8A54_20385 [Brucella pseudogrignonensis]|nr:hypothetical protein A8A54_20385 [Brucella pseudogrignonensis]